MGSDSSLKTVFLIHTGACNLLCSYCFNDGAEPELLSFDTIARFLDFRLEKYGKGGSVIHFGGEPLFNRDVIIKTIKAYPFLSHQIVTNGTMIDTAFLEEILPYNVEFEISIDGDYETTSRKRSISPSDFKRIMSIIRFIQTHKGDEAVYSSTVADPESCLTLSSSVKFLAQEAGLRSIGWNLARGMGYRYDPAALSRELGRAYQYADEERIRFYCVIPLCKGDACQHRSSISALTAWGDVLSEQNVYAFRKCRYDVYESFLLGTVESLHTLAEPAPVSSSLCSKKQRGECTGRYCTYLQLEELLDPSASAKECAVISLALSSISDQVEAYYQGLFRRETAH